MLNRRILRIKAFKTLYACTVVEGTGLGEVLKLLDRSCEAVRDLYLFLLALIPPLTQEARARMEAGKAKFHPTEEEARPNGKFAENALAPLLADDSDFRKIITRKQLSWDSYDLFVRHLFDAVKTKDYYRKYMEGEPSLAADCALFARIFREECAGNAELESILEEMSIWWTDDLDYALNVCVRTLKDLAAGRPWRLPELYQSDMVKRRKPEAEMENDKDFIHKLLSLAYSGYERYFALIAAGTPGWDADRLFSVDTALIVLGLAEIENFPSIDVKVSLNEYIEISKCYSAPKSRAFVNGLLHNLVVENFKERQI